MSLPGALQSLMRNSIATMIQYRGEVALWALWGIVYPIVSLAMWSAAIAGSGGQSLAGYDVRAFAAYFMLSMVVSHLITAWDAYEFGYLVRSGSLSPLLLRPLLPIWSSITDNLAYKLVTLVILIPIWAGLAWWTRPALEGTLAHYAVGLVALALAAVLTYLWGYCIATLAFWTTRNDGVAEFWFGGSLIFGGRLAPLALLPFPLQIVSMLLPFRWTVWFPIEVLSGRMPLTQAGLGLLAQCAWLIAGILLFRWMWSRGVRRYSAVGA